MTDQENAGPRYEVRTRCDACGLSHRRAAARAVADQSGGEPWALRLPRRRADPRAAP